MPSIERTQFGSNIDDRNLLFIYETSVVVGIPVTLVSLVAWPWYGDTTVVGLEVVPCDGSVPPSAVVEAFRVRSEGRGLTSKDRLQAEQAEAAIRGVTRKLFGASQLRAPVKGEVP